MSALMLAVYEGKTQASLILLEKVGIALDLQNKVRPLLF